MSEPDQVCRRRRLISSLTPLLVSLLGLNGLVAYVLDVKPLRSLSHLLLTSPLPLAYSSPEIASNVIVTLRFADDSRVTRAVTRETFASIQGPLQRRTALIYLFSKPDLLGADLVEPAIHHLFCSPGVILDELALKGDAPLSSLSWRLAYRGERPRAPLEVSYHCQRRALSLSR